MNIVDCTWFTLPDGSCVGIVVIQPEVGPRKAYMGLGEGISEEADKARIAESGYPVTADCLKGILKTLESK